MGYYPERANKNRKEEYSRRTGLAAWVVVALVAMCATAAAHAQTRGEDTVSITDPEVVEKLKDVVEHIGVPSENFLYLILVRNNGRSLLVSDRGWEDLTMSNNPVEDWFQLDFFVGWREWLATRENTDKFLPYGDVAKACKPCDGTVCCGRLLPRDAAMQ
jgi:hypothetical protein